ncbi:MAG: pilus assembly protein [Acidobacteriia bacterium]|nr:pilus assembly protein [Terriglobia bacterium]
MKGARSGSALIEFALVVPMFLLLCVAGVDMARVFNSAMKLTGATRTALEYAGVNANTASDVNGIVNLVATGTGNPSGLSVAVTQFCTCTVGGPQVACSSTCTSKLVYVQLTATMPFQTVAAWPYLPQPLNLTRSATIRVAYPPPGGGGIG